MRCLALFTGGLDSQLAVRLMQEQGIEVHGLYVTTPLCATQADSADSAAQKLGIPLTTIPLAEAYCQLLRHPRFGRLEGSAPCLDCRIAMFSQARRMMGESGAGFVVSGEVVGQRPRTAIRDLEVVAHHSGLEGRLLRPLSARLLPETIPESRDWVGATALLSMYGKGRKAQSQFAADLGLDVNPPGPDCPLLAAALGGRVKGLLDSTLAFGPAELALLPIGRQFPLGQQAWIILGRNREENEQMLARARRLNASDCATLEPLDFRGPVAVVWGTITAEICQQAAQLMVQSARTIEAETVAVVVRGPGGESQLWISNAQAAAAAEESGHV